MPFSKGGEDDYNFEKIALYVPELARLCYLGL